MSLSNTTQRILSAIALVGLLVLLIYIGGQALQYFMIVVSILLLDELYFNFLKLTRFSPPYLIGMSFYILFAFFLTEVLSLEECVVYILGIGLPLSLGSFCFLFFPRFFLKLFPFMSKKRVMVPGICLAVCVFWGGIFYILGHDTWFHLLVIILFTTFSTDSFAWLVGKNIGRTPLWPEVSPKKTREGAIGGYLGGALVGGLLWYYLIDSSFSASFFGVLLLPLIAQLGDLSQSRIKRWVGIKDSSNLIPGHGGLYDRVDSLMLVTPFFVIIIWGHYVG